MNRSTFAPVVLFALLTLALAIPAAAQETRVAPGNDNFANAAVVNPRALMNGTFSALSAQDATKEGGEPTPSCASGSAVSDTVWYKFTAPYEVHLTVDTFESTLNSSASNHNTVIAVYNSSSPSATFATLTQLYCSENTTSSGFFTWLPLGAGTYWLQVGSATALSSASTYAVEFGSKYQLLTNTSFGTTSAKLTPWTVSGTGTGGDKVVCNAIVPRIADSCVFRFKVSASESSLLSYKLKHLADLPHNTGPTNYSDLVLDVDVYTERAHTNATASIVVTFSNGTTKKGSRSLDDVGAIFVDPINGTTPTKATVKIKHNGKSGKPLYITSVQLYYAPGATGRSDVLPVPPPAQ